MFKLTGSASTPFQMIGSPVTVGGNPLRLYVNGSTMYSANMDGTICMLQVSQDNTAPLKVLTRSQSFGQRVINTAAYNSNNSTIFFLLDWRGERLRLCCHRIIILRRFKLWGMFI